MAKPDMPKRVVPWEYEDARGVLHVGYPERCYDYGGTDITYRMRDASTGEVHMLSGARLKSARVLHGQLVDLWQQG